MSHPKVGPRDRLLWAAVDLDGTLAQPLWAPGNPTSDIGEPIWENVEKLMKLHEAGVKVIPHTARADTDYEAIEAWFRYYGIPLSQGRIRTGKPLAAMYIDDRGVSSDHPDWLAEYRRLTNHA